MMFIIILFIVLVGGGWLLGKGLGEALFGEKKETYTFNSTHVHHHHHEHKNISIIDDKTKEEVIVYQKSIDKNK
jgi:hypothetical protein